MFGVNQSKLMETGWLEGRPRRQLHLVDSVILHRISVGENAVEVANWFRTHPEALGTPMMPYTYIITRDGKIQQAHWLVTKSPHALRWNARSIGIGLIGDFRKKAPPSVQVDATAALIVRLNDTLRRPLAIYGHTMWHPCPKETTKHIDKQCPGPLFEQAYKEILDQVRACGAIHLGA